MKKGKKAPSLRVFLTESIHHVQAEGFLKNTASRAISY